MINIVPFEIDDMENFHPVEKIDNLLETMEVSLKNPYREILSLKDDKGLFCILGLNILRDRAGEVWIIPNMRMNDHKLGVFKSIKYLVEGYIFQEKGFHRLEFAVDSSYPKGIKFAQKLGFEIEGLMKRWDGKKDHFLFARVR